MNCSGSYCVYSCVLSESTAGFSSWVEKTHSNNSWSEWFRPINKRSNSRFTILVISGGLQSHNAMRAWTLQNHSESENFRKLLDSPKDRRLKPSAACYVLWDSRWRLEIAKEIARTCTYRCFPLLVKCSVPFRWKGISGLRISISINDSKNLTSSNSFLYKNRGEARRALFTIFTTEICRACVSHSKKGRPKSNFESK